MAFDRSKFTGAKLSANKDVQKDAATKNRSLLGSDRARAEYHKIEDGRNVFRIMPPHPEDTIGASYLPYRTSTLECEVPVFKDGEDTGKTEVKNKKVFIATQHGGLEKDPIELYIEYVRRRANDEFDNKDDRQKFLCPITGWRDNKGTWQWGIAPKLSFTAYALKDGKVGRLELFEQMVKDMDRLAMQEEAGEAIEVDPFSDPDEGQELIITRQKAVDKQGKETGKWEHIVSMGMPSKKETWPDYFERTRVTDEQLEQLSKLEPLSKIQGNEVYTKRDFELAMDGLRRFDEKHKYQIFDNDEFLQELSEIEALVPEKRDEDIKEMFSDENAAKLADKKKSTDVDETADDDNGIGDDKPTPSEMKIALKRYIRKEFGETYVEQIPTNQKKLEQWYALYEDGDELPIALKQGTSSNESQKTDDAAVDTREATEEVSPDIAKLRARRRSAQN